VVEIPDYVVVGHVCKDLVPDGYTVGGTATYAALTAQRLGVRTGVVTSAAPHFRAFAPDVPIAVQCRCAAQTTTFENIYRDTSRQQYLRATAEPLGRHDLPPEWERAPMVHLGPVAQEVQPDLIHAFSQSLVGVTPQGWLRRWNAEGLVSVAEWDLAQEILSLADVVILSPEDVGHDHERLEQFAEWSPLLVLTLGPRGADVYHDGEVTHVPAFEAAQVDPTGAGDVFAAAYIIRLYECGDIIEAARFANCVASFVVEARGAANLPSREQVAWRLEHGRLRNQASN
jgi:sugar/nucleoside kinase (ribokinase family)